MNDYTRFALTALVAFLILVSWYTLSSAEEVKDDPCRVELEQSQRALMEMSMQSFMNKYALDECADAYRDLAIQYNELVDYIRNHMLTEHTQRQAMK